MAHIHSIIVRGFHCDAYGHVNNARYLEFLEESRWAALETHNLIERVNELGLQFFVVNINISFKKALLPNDSIHIETKLGEVKRKTISFIQTISKGEDVAAAAEVTFVLFDEANKKAATIEESHVTMFKSF